MRPINKFLLDNNLRIAQNPCISPDFCLDWPALGAKLKSGGAVHVWPKSSFSTAAGTWKLVEDERTGDCAWHFTPQPHEARVTPGLSDGVPVYGGATVFPATWENLLALKNAVQQHDASSTIFPNA
jgi:hypothetical protein